MADNGMMATAYHKDNPDVPVPMYAVDAQNAVQGYPDEWSYSPWPAKKGKKAAASAPADVEPSAPVDALDDSNV